MNAKAKRRAKKAPQPVDRKTGLRTNHTPSRHQRKIPFGSGSASTAPAAKDRKGSVSASTPSSEVAKIIPAKSLIVPLKAIRPSPTNPRKHFDQASLQSLANKIRVLGFHGRIYVVAAGKDQYEIVYGERRWRAAGMAGLKEIPVDVVVLTQEKIQAIQLSENDEREDLLLSERVAEYGRYADQGKTPEQIRALTGESIGEVRRMLLLRRAPKDVLEAVDQRRLSIVAAADIARVPGEKTRNWVAAHVLGGHYHSYNGSAGKPPRYDADSQPLSVRTTKEFISQHCRQELKGAPFSRTALDLIPGVPSCDACPKLAGNAAKEDPEYANVREDTCLDPECYSRKVEAHDSKKIDAMKKDGRTFLPPREAAKAFGYGSQLSYNAPYYDLDSTCYSDPKSRAYRTLLNGCIPKDKVVVAIDPSGKPRELVDKKVANGLLKQTGAIKAERREPTAEDKKRKREERIQVEMTRLAMEAAAAAGEKLIESGTFNSKGLVAMCPLLADEFWHQSKDRMLRRRKWPTVAPADGRQALGVLTELLACTLLSSHTDAKKKGPFFAALGIDLKKIEADAAAIADGKKVASNASAHTAPASVSASTQLPGSGPIRAKDLLDKVPPAVTDPKPAESTPVKFWPSAELVLKALRLKGFDLGGVPKEKVPIETRLDQKLIFLQCFPQSLAKLLQLEGIRTVRELLERVDQDAGGKTDAIEARLISTLSAIGGTAADIRHGATAIADLFAGVKAA